MFINKSLNANCTIPFTSQILKELDLKKANKINPKKNFQIIN